MEKNKELTKAAMDQLLRKYPNGCPDHVIAKKFGITEKELDSRYKEIVACLRFRMRV